jgi:flagellar hook protein FlgE
MFASTALSLSGLSAAQTQLDVAGHNIANLGTQGFRRQQVVQVTLAAGGVGTTLSQASAPGNDLQADVVEQLKAKNAFMANMAVFKAGDRMLGALLDIQG